VKSEENRGKHSLLARNNLQYLSDETPCHIHVQGGDYSF